MIVEPADYLRCQDLLFRLWDALDHRRLDDFIGRLTPDARWRRDRWYEGVAAIRAVLEARTSGMVVRHVLTNLILDPTDRGFTARVLVLPQLAMAEAEQSLPLTARPMGIVNTATVSIVRAGDELKVSEIDLQPVFRLEG